MLSNRHTWEKSKYSVIKECLVELKGECTDGRKNFLKSCIETSMRYVSPIYVFGNKYNVHLNGMYVIFDSGIVRIGVSQGGAFVLKNSAYIKDEFNSSSKAASDLLNCLSRKWTE